MKTFSVKRGRKTYVVDAVSEEDAILFVGRGLFDMANLWRSETGLPFGVWVQEPTEGSKLPHNKWRVKYGNDFQWDCISVSFFDKPAFEIRAGRVDKVKGMTDGDVTKLRKWLNLNYDLLVKLANGEINGGQFRNAMQKV